MAALDTKLSILNLESEKSRKLTCSDSQAKTTANALRNDLGKDDDHYCKAVSGEQSR